MDIERHDDLMKVPPPVIQSVFQSQENRPRSIAYYDSFIQDLHGKRPKEAFDRKNNGDKVIGAFCAFFPEEFVHAAGAVPPHPLRRGQVSHSRRRKNHFPGTPAP